MDRFGIQLNLEHIAAAREKWAMAYAKFASEVDYMMSRLLNEAAINRLSVEQVARWSGMKPSRVRQLMRDNNLNPKQSKTLLAQTAAEALQENAALLGIEPWEMDLMSPLAYLPMGSELREQLAETDDSDTYCGAEFGEARDGECECPRCAAKVSEQAGVSGNPTTEVTAKIIQAATDFAATCFAERGPQDARGAALWDFAAWLREEFKA